MYRRYAENARAIFSRVKLRPFSALQECLKGGYGRADLRADLMAGAVVGLVAVPLAMALAIASGTPPQHGLYTAVVAGFAVALLGGSRCQVTGPTAAFVVVLAPVVGKFGLSGLLVAGLMAGVILLLMGLAGMGQLIQYIPHPVTTGFTSGIAVVIATLQFKDFLGLDVPHMPERYFDRVAALAHALPTWSPAELGVGTFTLALLVLWPRVSKKVPAPLVALTAAALAALALKRFFPSLSVDTIGSRFSFQANGGTMAGIPRALPAVRPPWNLPGPGGQTFAMSWHALEALTPAAFAIAMLGAIESLLSAVVADGMTRTRHDPDAELAALGVGNILCPFFGAIPATGAIARTATNIRFGAKSPVAAMAHAAFVLLAVLLLAPAISHLPMAGLAALLLLVAYNMAEVRHFRHILNVAPRSDVMVLLLCFGLTVAFDMVIGVSVGLVLASLLFMRRMALVTVGRALPEDHRSRANVKWPPGVAVYEIAGPLFFGAVDNAIDAIEKVDGGVRAVVFMMEDVPVMDVTGLVALESAVQELVDHGKTAFLVGVRPQPMELIQKSPLGQNPEKVRICLTLQQASTEAGALFPAR